MADFLSRRDIDFLLHEWLDVTALTKRDHFAEHSRDTFDAVLDLSADIAAKLFAPHNKKGDQIQPVVGSDGSVVLIDEIKEALDAFSAAGLMAGPFDEAIGGMQLPTVVSQAALAFARAANPSTTAYAFLTMGNANLLAEYGSREQIDTWVRPMLEGRYFGTMCLSEPEAGSSLADITTKAVRTPDGTYRVTGTKMWITGGDHELTENIVHLVLAKAPGGGPGVKGISLFIVPKFLPDGTRNDVALVSLNHKMGNHATTNALLNFGDGTYPVGGVEGAVGYLVGEEHKGLAYMFHMMNEARMAVGLQATATGYAGYLASLEYAKQRTQGRPVGNKDATVRPVALIEHADVKRMLLAQKSYVEGGLALGLYCAHLVDEARTGADGERDRAHLLLEVLTPIAKSWPSQWCLEANSLAIQIHGGYGYTTEFDVEQYYRDNRLNAIHEGTHGIHGLDLLGRKVVMQDGAGLALLVARIGETIDRAAATDYAATQAGALRQAVQRLQEVTAILWSADDIATTLANATVYMEAVGHVVVAWLWLEQLLAASDNQGSFYDGKRAAAQYFFTYELPKVGPQFDLLASLDRVTVEARPDWF
ncbi:acyl-CoA dehydrogenase [Mycolicibacterium canariasense]|uniref:Acyl-CoA dehydrogenase n=1 Tax=Mycolicibacterium canariasense TaxID=228230 RepID=A0A117IAW3_MYCCR|nr:acyl-CoA dehydrogenase [Mycolicibacterium canariasense]MCV7211601.1 acyl-CoA dehydrogenase [Mycolicibacterium canariasense]ORV00396.1 acyl-CoA dehydrogenase [Mycolicibacterium canariasense]GAS96992.1 acyl-CoA dehydrogenase [Mycolicibacterium canariasense]